VAGARPVGQGRGREGFIAACEAFKAEGGILIPYSCVGVRGDVDLMLWRIHQELEPLQRHAVALRQTAMGPYFDTPYALLGMTKRSTYVDHIHPEHEDDRLTIVPGTQKYIFVYPFVKTREWYGLDPETRQKMMREHIHVGTTYPSVKLNTTYSFGLDDQEFVVAFESDRADDFLDLVQDLRETAASRYTLRDTPTFTCVRWQLRMRSWTLSARPSLNMAPPSAQVDGTSVSFSSPERGDEAPDRSPRPSHLSGLGISIVRRIWPRVVATAARSWRPGRAVWHLTARGWQPDRASWHLTARGGNLAARGGD
jgi:chlorite dismutase